MLLSGCGGGGGSSSNTGGGGSNPTNVTSIVSITITTDSQAAIIPGSTVQFTAIGQYSDGSNQDVTNSVTWSSSAPGIVSISNASGSYGLATGIAPGGSEISASLSGITSNKYTLNVISPAANVTSLAIAPQESQINLGSTQQYTATATYSDGNTYNVSADSKTIWSSSPESIATVNNTGLVSGISLGSATISVNYTDSYGNKVESSTAVIITSPVKLAWSKNALKNDILTQISADPNGNIYTTSWSAGTVYITKYDNNGNQVWKQSRIGDIMSTSISADNASNAYATGYNYAGKGYYLAKYNQSGELQWDLQESNGALMTYGYAVTVDNKGKVYVVGKDGNGYFIAQYNTDGKLQWTVENGGKYAYAYAVSADNNNGVYVTGNGASNAFFIAKYTSSGSLEWVNQNNSYHVTGYGIDTDNNGKVYVTGGDGISLEDGFISAYDANDGTLLWTRNSFTQSGVGVGLSVDNRGRIYALGAISDSKHNPSAYYLAKYDAQGSLQQWSTINSSGAGPFQGGVSVDNNGRIYVGGNPTSNTYFLNQYSDY